MTLALGGVRSTASSLLVSTIAGRSWPRRSATWKARPDVVGAARRGRHGPRGRVLPRSTRTEETISPWLSDARRADGLSAQDQAPVPPPVGLASDWSHGA